MKRLVFTSVELNNKKLMLSGLMEEGRLAEARLDVLPGDCASKGILKRLPGNIYIGKVQRVIPNLNAAFVEIAPGLPCYLPFKKAVRPVFVKRRHSEGIFKDDEILVQVERDAVRGKAPTLTANLNFTGRYAVLTTGNGRIGISSKLDGAARNRMRRLLKQSLGGISLPEGCGLIVRTNAAGASDEEIISEIRQLAARMDEVIGRAGTHVCFSCLLSPDPVYLNYLRGAYSKGLDEIITDLPGVYEDLKGCCGRYGDLKDIPLKLYEDDSFPLCALLNLNREIMRATSRQVRLKSGGFLVIDPTEAMTVIDVNTGKSSGEKAGKDFFLRTNREASAEIARQLRLRNISGIVIIDYIDLETDEQKRELTEDLKRLAGDDPVPVTVHDITALNLVEITRKKVEKSLAEQIKLLTMNNSL